MDEVKPQWMSNHEQSDLMQFEAIHARLDMLATKDDVKEVLLFMKHLNVGVGIFKFSWNNASKIGGVLLFFFGFFVFIKYGIMGLIAWFIPKL